MQNKPNKSKINIGVLSILGMVDATRTGALLIKCDQPGADHLAWIRSQGSTGKKRASD